MSIENLRNKYSGRIFLIGSGPSLKETPLELLEDEYTFSVNNIPDVFEEVDWRPSFYACVDNNVDTFYCHKAIDLGIPCFFPTSTSRSSSLGDKLPNEDNVFFFDSCDVRDNPDVDIGTFQINWDSIDDTRDIWSEDVGDFLYNYNTIMYSIMQISYYMGFDEMYLVGNDLYNTTQQYLLFPNASDPAGFPGEYQSKFNKAIEFIQEDGYPLRSLINGFAYKIIKSEPFKKTYPLFGNYMASFGQENYFSDNYAVGEIVTPEKNKRHICAHQLAKCVATELDFEIYNATIGGHLEVHPRVDIHDLLG